MNAAAVSMPPAEDDVANGVCAEIGIGTGALTGTLFCTGVGDAGGTGDAFIALSGGAG